jgi:hypothetical protein
MHLKIRLMNAVGCIYLLATTGLYVYPLPRSGSDDPFPLSLVCMLQNCYHSPALSNFL